VLAIFSYELDVADAAFDDANVSRHVLTGFNILTDVAHERGDLSAAELATLSEWRSDPEAWSVAHGGIRAR
jgi:orotate phosphoribosyltransferase